MWATIRELVGDGITLLLTTQYLEEADALADRVVLIDHGREVAAGTPAQLKAQVGEQRVDVIAADCVAFAELAALLEAEFATTFSPSCGRSRSPRPRGRRSGSRRAAVNQAQIPVDEIALRRPTLDDAFLALTGPCSREGRRHADAA